MSNKADFSGVSSSVDTTAQVVSQSSPNPAPAAARTHTVAKGDTLSAIAKQYLGKANDWPKIFEANRDVLKDPDKIQVGQVLKIPAANN
ncbi:hypothetical protein ABB30_03575 [Stenotrophomonas ginsengisoli]|uniref:Potassium binding protein Kbp n=1 Tax=Stenotrophomonas ginsengisoli TaxID=336566 RepID=A0A0R0DJ96_9GAMM|nr:LysM peptidoglycan-binding domain-containing protein [Stenotrophomonas ginsengisoli]KRG78407.1 hypothetical protein ABB30_03575 [Stenotrophomonas ginsengisoli]